MLRNGRHGEGIVEGRWRNRADGAKEQDKADGTIE